MPSASHGLCSTVISVCFWFLALCSKETAALTLSLLEENVYICSLRITSHSPPALSEGENTRAMEQPELKNTDLDSAQDARAQLCLERLKVLLYKGEESLWR